ncbi:MAG TPA: glycosyltransferase family 2 protein [Dehalococcoidia bacterium]|nr:glycosyltransferase family 2 protein [Dehalococcoidia bacterium]
MTDKTKIIAALPAYNEEKYIGTLVLKTKQYVDEVIVVDDGSTDQTGDIARLAGAIVIQHNRNKGKGASIQTILAEAKERNPNILVLLDADSQHNPDEIPSLIKAILDGYDLIIGSRVQQSSNIPRYRRIGQRVLSYFSRILSGEKVADSQCGFRALSLKAIAELKLTQSGFAVEAEMITAAAEKGLKITEVPISVIYTKDGSTLNPVRLGFGILAQILAMISERRPLLLFGLFGFILTVVGLIAGARVLYTVSIGGGIATGTALLSTSLLIIGIFSIFTGIILNVLAKRRKD